MTQLVGILNLTPDSFSDGGQFNTLDKAIAQADKLFEDGASLIDLGAESTRPNATPLEWQEEWERLSPVLTELLELYPDSLSVDTYHPETAEQALLMGDVIINDVTGMNNPAMREIIVKHYARVIVSHLPGRDVQAAHEGKLIADRQQVIDELLARAWQLEQMGLGRRQIILDPGMGLFLGSHPDASFTVLRQIGDLKRRFALPVLISVSRKSFLRKLVGRDVPDIGPATLAAELFAVRQGADLIRTHDPRALRDALAVFRALESNKA